MAAEEDGRRIWLEEHLGSHLRWSIGVKSILHSGKSKFQAYDLVDSVPFGKILLLDGMAQSAEADERTYHECLVHPAMLAHPNPKTVFICGGGEGSTAREVLRHKSVEKCVMVDIDELVCKFCAEHLEANSDAFQDPRLELIHDDAMGQLRDYAGTFDVIIGDLNDPVDGGPCFQMYTHEFYKKVVCAKLNEGGIFVTQSGACGMLSAPTVFTSIHNTLKNSFPQVVPYHCHVPSFVDEWGWNLAFKTANGKPLSAEETDKCIADRGLGEMSFLDGTSWTRISSVSKPVRKAIAAEKHVLTEADPRFMFGKGINA